MSLTNEGVSFTMPVEPGGSSDRNSGWGGDWGAWIILFLIFGMFGWGGFGGFGGFGGGLGGGAGLQGMATRADINEGFALNNLQSGINAIQQGICDSTYALNNAISSGFNNTNMGMMQGFNGVERGFCTRDIIDSQNAGTRAILDYLCQDKISSLQNENQALRLAASQSNQNAILMAAMDANKADILRRTGNDCPVPAYVVQPSTPVSFPTSCCGQFNGWNNNGGCNNGCGGCNC